MIYRWWISVSLSNCWVIFPVTRSHWNKCTFYMFSVFRQCWASRASSWCCEKKTRCYPQQLESFCVFDIKKCLCHKNYSKCLCHRKTSEPFGISQSICTGTLRNRTELSGASAGIFTGNLRNLTRYLHQNPPEPCPEPGEAAPDRTANLG